MKTKFLTFKEKEDIYKSIPNKKDRDKILCVINYYEDVIKNHELHMSLITAYGKAILGENN